MKKKDINKFDKYAKRFTAEEVEAAENFSWDTDGVEQWIDDRQFLAFLHGIEFIKSIEKSSPAHTDNQEEPTQEELSNEAERFFNENYSGTAMSDFLKPYIINTYKMGHHQKTKVVPMEEIKLSKHAFENIRDAINLSHRILECSKRETAADRQINYAFRLMQWIAEGQEEGKMPKWIPVK